MSARGMGWAGAAGLAAVVALAGAAAAADAVRARGERLYGAAERKLAAAQTLHVQVKNALDRGRITEYWFRKPNRFRVNYADGSRAFCDGKTLVRIAEDGKRATAAAPAEVPQDDRPLDFESFFSGKAFPGKLRSLEVFEFGGIKRKAWWVQTTESAIMFGMMFVNPETGFPVGHKTTEMNEVVTNQWYPLIRLNEKLPDKLFRAPGR
jgi:outer membrane lipoprotein-sorting protein